MAAEDEALGGRGVEEWMCNVHGGKSVVWGWEGEMSSTGVLVGGWRVYSKEPSSR